MAKQTIGIGSTANDGTGDPLRTAFDKCNDNFDEIYLATNPSLIADNNYIVNPTYNTIDTASGVTRSVVSGGGQTGAANHIGQEARPTSAHPESPAEWANDTSYPADGTAGSVATIGGGYDNVNNQLAGTICGGGHNFIKYDADGHSVICGGSFNIIAAGRGFIGGGRYNTITQDNGFVGGGASNRVSGTNGAGIICGASNTASGAASIVFGGASNTASGTYSAVAGFTNLADKDYATVFGRDGRSIAPFSLTIGGTDATVQGDTQTMRCVGGARTTNDTLTTTGCTLNLSDTDDYFATGSVRIIGHDESTNDIVVFNENISLKMIAGTTTFYNAAGTSTAPGSTAETMNLTPVVDEITVGTCQLRATTGATGQILVRVTGKAATTIKWTAELDLTVSILD